VTIAAQEKQLMEAAQPARTKNEFEIKLNVRQLPDDVIVNGTGRSPE
jgi:hypothetical protein